METQIWIIGQIIIDIVLVALLLWFIRFHYKRYGTKHDFGAAFRRSEAILSEMKQIGQALEKNLEQKKELSGHILGQLNEGLKRAKDCYRQINKINREYSMNITDQPIPLKDSNHARSSINALLSKGLSKEEIAQHFGVSVDEIELLLKLRSQNDSSRP